MYSHLRRKTREEEKNNVSQQSAIQLKVFILKSCVCERHIFIIDLPYTVHLDHFGTTFYLHKTQKCHLASVVEIE